MQRFQNDGDGHAASQPHRPAGSPCGGPGSAQKLTKKDALDYLKEVKKMFRDRSEKYDELLQLMKDFKAQRINATCVVLGVKELFKGYPKLILGFNTFLPKGYEITLDDETLTEKKIALTFINRVKTRFQNDKQVYMSFLKILSMHQKEHVSLDDVYQKVALLFKEHQDLLEEFANFLPDAAGVDPMQHDLVDRSLAMPMKGSSMNYHADRNLSIGGPTPDDKAGAEIFGVHPISESLGNGGHLGTNVKVDDRDKEMDHERDDGEKDRDSEREKDTEQEQFDKNVAKDSGLPKVSVLQNKETYVTEPISELDLMNCQSWNPSYHRLPENYPRPKTSLRTELAASVLNDDWVSRTTGCSDRRKKQYEEILFRFEGDRFDLDMLLESVNSTIKRVEDLIEKIDNTIKPDSQIHIQDYFTVLNLRCIERLYGVHGLDLLDVLHENPRAALPVILIRLKQKLEECLRLRSDLNKMWAESRLRIVPDQLTTKTSISSNRIEKSSSTKVHWPR